MQYNDWAEQEDTQAVKFVKHLFDEYIYIMLIKSDFHVEGRFQTLSKTMQSMHVKKHTTFTYSHYRKTFTVQL